MLPGVGANMAPVFVRRVFKKLAVPIDFNKGIKGKPVFGKNKTYRGLVFAILVAILIAYIQYVLYSYSFFRRLSFIDYSNWLVFGFLMGFGVMFGDLIGSFFKRRLGIKPGKPFLPVDQIDAAIGGLLFILFVYIPPLNVIITVVLLSFVISAAVHILGYYLGLRKIKW